MYGYIYLTTNKVNGLIYVGQKKSEKFLGESYLGSGQNIKRAINKYGKENFIVIQIDSADSKEELNSKEIYWIEKYNSRNPDIGYNLAIGGDNGFTGCSHSEDSKKKTSTALKGRKKHDGFGEKVSRGRIGIEPWNKGKHTRPLTELEKKRQSEAHIGQPSWCKGLTKEDDDRLLKLSISVKRSIIERKQNGTYPKAYNKGKKCYNNGVRDIFLSEDDEVPDGYVIGGKKRNRVKESTGKTNYENK